MDTLLDLRDLETAEARARLDRALVEAGASGEVLCFSHGTAAPFPWSGVRPAGSPLSFRPLVVAPGRLLVAVRPGAWERTGRSSITAFMRMDHARIDALVSGVAEAAGRRDRPLVELLFALLDEVLRRHAEVEESLLLPVISARHGQPRGPAAVLRDQHKGIHWALDDLGEILAYEGELETVRARAAALASTLGDHMALEEELVYALADEHMDEGERASLLDFCAAMA